MALDEHGVAFQEPGDLRRILLSAGNAQIYQRDDIVCRRVTGLPPSELAVIWRPGDERRAVQVFVEACERCFCAQ